MKRFVLSLLCVCFLASIADAQGAPFVYVKTTKMGTGGDIVEAVENTLAKFDAWEDGIVASGDWAIFRYWNLSNTSGPWDIPGEPPAVYVQIRREYELVWIGGGLPGPIPGQGDD